MKPSALKLLLSVVIWILSAMAIFMLLIFVFVSLGLIGWTDGGDSDFVRRLERNTTIFITVSVIGAITSASLLVYFIYKKKQPNN